MNTIYIKFHNNPYLVPPNKLPNDIMDIYDGHMYGMRNKGGYMDKGGCVSNSLCNVSPYVSMKNMVLSVYYRDYLQLGLYAVAGFFSTGVYWLLG